MKTYIIASSKPWHLKKFEYFCGTSSGQWKYVATPEALNQSVQTVSPRYIFFLHWNWLVPKEIWCRFECVCFHMTDVPFGRGGSPLQNLIQQGIKETKLTALRMVEEMDAGPVYAKRPMKLHGRAEDIYFRAGELSWELIFWIAETQPDPVPQQGKITVFKRRSPDQSVLPSKGSLSTFYDHIRMLDAPTYPLAFIEYGEFRMEFSHVEIDGKKIRAQVIIQKKDECKE